MSTTIITRADLRRDSANMRAGSRGRHAANKQQRETELAECAALDLTEALSSTEPMDADAAGDWQALEDMDHVVVEDRLFDRLAADLDWRRKQYADMKDGDG
jgi:hypothetical protein